MTHVNTDETSFNAQHWMPSCCPETAQRATERVTLRRVFYRDRLHDTVCPFFIDVIADLIAFTPGHRVAVHKHPQEVFQPDNATLVVLLPQTWTAVGRVQEQGPAGAAAARSCQELRGTSQSSGKRLHDEVRCNPGLLCKVTRTYFEYKLTVKNTYQGPHTTGRTFVP
jgi:hypothetical protein